MTWSNLLFCPHTAHVGGDYFFCLVLIRFWIFLHFKILIPQWDKHLWLRLDQIFGCFYWSFISESDMYMFIYIYDDISGLQIQIQSTFKCEDQIFTKPTILSPYSTFQSNPGHSHFQTHRNAAPGLSATSYGLHHWLVFAHLLWKWFTPPGTRQRAAADEDHRMWPKAQGLKTSKLNLWQFLSTVAQSKT